MLFWGCCWESIYLHVSSLPVFHFRWSVSTTTKSNFPILPQKDSPNRQLITKQCLSKEESLLPWRRARLSSTPTIFLLRSCPPSSMRLHGSPGRLSTCPSSSSEGSTRLPPSCPPPGRRQVSTRHPQDPRSHLPRRLLHRPSRTTLARPPSPP